MQGMQRVTRAAQSMTFHTHTLSDCTSSLPSLQPPQLHSTVFATRCSARTATEQGCRPKPSKLRIRANRAAAACRNIEDLDVVKHGDLVIVVSDIITEHDTVRTVQARRIE